jgi:hypothetical protein
MSLRFTSMTIAAICIGVPALSHSAETLNVKLGLWEITSVTQTHGMPPLPKELLSKLTPEQRRKMETDLKAEQAKGPDTDTDRECITPKDIERPFESANTKECKQTIVTTTRTSQEVRIVCTGGMPGSGLLKISTSHPEKMTGSLKLKLGEGTEAMTIDARLQGRWLSGDCGDEAEASDDDVDSDSGDDPN